MLSLFVIHALLALLLPGCWQTDGMGLLDERYPPPDGDGEVEADGDAPADGDRELVAGEGLDGWWALYMKLNASIEILGPTPGTIENLFLVEGGEGGLALTFCDQITTIESSLAPPTDIPAKLATALQQQALTLARSGDTLPAQQVVWLWGVCGMTDPLNDPLPDAPGGQYECDHDGDGHPGVTVDVVGTKMKGGHRFMVQRAVWNLAAGTLSTDRQTVSGTLAFTAAQNALGAIDNEGEPYNLINQAAPITDAGGSSYRFVRLPQPADGDADMTVAGCAAVLERFEAGDLDLR